MVFRERSVQEVEVQVAEAKDEAEESTGRDFLFTLWTSHLEMDFPSLGMWDLNLWRSSKQRLPRPYLIQFLRQSKLLVRPLNLSPLTSLNLPHDSPAQCIDPPV